MRYLDALSTAMSRGMAMPSGSPYLIGPATWATLLYQGVRTATPCLLAMGSWIPGITAGAAALTSWGLPIGLIGALGAQVVLSGVERGVGWSAGALRRWVRGDPYAAEHITGGGMTHHGFQWDVALGAVVTGSMLAWNAVRPGSGGDMPLPDQWAYVQAAETWHGPYLHPKVYLPSWEAPPQPPPPPPGKTDDAPVSSTPKPSSPVVSTQDPLYARQSARLLDINNPWAGGIGAHLSHDERARLWFTSVGMVELRKRLEADAPDAAFKYAAIRNANTNTTGGDIDRELREMPASVTKPNLGGGLETIPTPEAYATAVRANVAKLLETPSLFSFTGPMDAQTQGEIMRAIAVMTGPDFAASLLEIAPYAQRDVLATMQGNNTAVVEAIFRAGAAPVGMQPPGYYCTTRFPDALTGTVLQATLLPESQWSAYQTTNVCALLTRLPETLSGLVEAKREIGPSTQAPPPSPPPSPLSPPPPQSSVPPIPLPRERQPRTRRELPPRPGSQVSPVLPYFPPNVPPRQTPGPLPYRPPPEFSPFDPDRPRRPPTTPIQPQTPVIPGPPTSTGPPFIFPPSPGIPLPLPRQRGPRGWRPPNPVPPKDKGDPILAARAQLVVYNREFVSWADAFLLPMKDLGVVGAPTPVGIEMLMHYAYSWYYSGGAAIALTEKGEAAGTSTPSLPPPPGLHPTPPRSSPRTPPHLRQPAQPCHGPPRAHLAATG